MIVKERYAIIKLQEVCSVNARLYIVAFSHIFYLKIFFIDLGS